jgi:hypothetical protein
MSSWTSHYIPGSRIPGSRIEITKKHTFKKIESDYIVDKPYYYLKCNKCNLTAFIEYENGCEKIYSYEDLERAIELSCEELQIKDIIE